MKENKETHESYGMIGVSRRQCSPAQNLFGSSVKHQSTVAITIKHCEKHRDLSRDWYFAHGTIVQVEMSPVQFAEMITGLNVGDGVPCTLRYLPEESKLVAPENPPHKSQRQVFDDEFQDQMNNVTSTVYGDVEEAKELLNKKGTITVKERKKISNIIERVVDQIRNTLPFIKTQFNRSMDKTTMEAKGEVEAFITNKVQSLGIEAIREELPQIEHTK